MVVSSTQAPGRVTIVGAGPGDADLLTVRAVQCIQSADIIFYDALVSDEIRVLFPPAIPCIYVGKRKGRHAISQAGINQALLDQAKLGLTVCRLKGGDPFIFGRGGEEALVLRAAGIPVDIVPGITAANGCAAAAGIPLTHRGITLGCTFVTAHSRADHVDGISSDINWSALASIGTTLVFYMGLTRSEHIRSELCRHGMAASTPVAIVERGGTANQRVITGRLDALVELVADHTIEAPALIIVGDVVDLHALLSLESANINSPSRQLSA